MHTEGRCRRWVAPPCSSASWCRWRSRADPAVPGDVRRLVRAAGVLAAGVMFAVGALDDLRDVSPPAKIAGQVLAGSILSLMGVSMLFFRVPFFGASSCSRPTSPRWSPCSSVVLFANAINLIDGLDGLAAGIVDIAGSAVFLYSDRLFKDGFLTASNIAPLIAMIAVGDLHRLPSVELQPGEDLHGRRRRDVPRPVDGRLHDHPRRSRRLRVLGPDLLLLRSAVHPARDPRCPDARHRVLVPPTGVRAADRSQSPTRTISIIG